jgi:hypothetical protein
MLSVIVLNIIVLSFIMMNVIEMSVIMLSVIMQFVIMLGVMMLGVINQVLLCFVTFLMVRLGPRNSHKINLSLNALVTMLWPLPCIFERALLVFFIL